MHLVQKGVQGFAAQLRGDQAVADQFKIAAELIDGGVVKGFMSLKTIMSLSRAFLRGLPARFRELVVTHQCQFQSLEDVAELQPVWLEAIASRPFLVHLRKAQPVHFQRFEQLRRHLTPLHRDAELIAQRLYRADIELEHQLALVASGPPGDLRGYRGVAVPVRSNPGAEGAERRLRELHIRVVAAQG